MRDGWMKALGSAGLTCEELMVEVQGSSTEKECLGFTTDKMSKGISLPKQRAQSCQAACQRDRARWDGSLSLPPPTPSRPPHPCAVLETKLSQTCVNSWEKHPWLCFVKVIKITPPGRPAAGLRPQQVCFSWREGSLSARARSPSQQTSRQHFPTLHFHPCHFLF